MKSGKKYPIKPTKKQIEVFKQGWEQLQKDEDTFRGLVMATERWMANETGIKDIEFIHNADGGGYCGIGNAGRTMRLIQQDKLE